MSSPVIVGFEKLTVAGTAVGFASIPKTAMSALVSVETASVRYRADGTAPDGTTGTLVAAGEKFVVNGNLAEVLLIRTGSSATLQVQYFDSPAIHYGVAPGATVGTVTTSETRAATGTVTSVNDTASSTTLLAANANRLGARIVNDSTSTLYVKFGATASATSFTHKLLAGETLIEDQYTGVIDGIWASDASGAARVTELT